MIKRLNTTQQWKNRGYSKKAKRNNSGLYSVLCERLKLLCCNLLNFIKQGDSSKAKSSISSWKVFCGRRQYIVMARYSLKVYSFFRILMPSISWFIWRRESAHIGLVVSRCKTKYRLTITADLRHCKRDYLPRFRRYHQKWYQPEN